jgi:hypothetical protein
MQDLPNRYFWFEIPIASGNTELNANQGDQIGRIFAYWATIGQWFENYGSRTNFWAVYALLLRKNVLGSILGDFFTNSSGRPG